MPVIPVPAMSNATFFDGTPLAANDVCVPMILIVDSNGKMASYRGNPITLQDVRDPEVAGFEVAQAPATYAFAPSGGQASDDASGTLTVYHVVSTALETAASLSNIVTAFGEGFGVAGVASYAANSAVSLSALSGLGTSNVYDSGAGLFRDIAEGDSVYSHILVEDPNGRVASASQFVPLVQDITPPAFSGGPTVLSTNQTSATVSWTLADAGDAAAGAATPLYLGVYTSDASPPSAQDVVDGAGAAFLRRIVVADGKATGTEVVGDASPASDAALSPATPYYVYVVAEDSVGNRTARQDLVVTTTDGTSPGGLSSVTVALGTNDPTTEVLVSGLQNVSDNDELATLSARYGTVNDAADAETATVAISLSGGTAASDTHLVTGLTPDTPYYFWTRATDPSGNDSGAVSTTPGSVRTDSASSLYGALGSLYPPAALTGSSTTLSGQGYGNGTYNVSYTGTYLERPPWQAFNKDYRWSNQAGGNLDDSTWMGWVSDGQDNVTIHLPEAVTLTAIKCINGYNTSDTFDSDWIVRQMVVEGSNDGVAFTQLFSNSGGPSADVVLYRSGQHDGWFTRFEIPVTEISYSYFRITVANPDRFFCVEMQLFVMLSGTNTLVSIPGAFGSDALALVNATFDNPLTKFPLATKSSMTISGSELALPVSTLDGFFGTAGFVGGPRLVKGPFVSSEFTGFEVDYRISATTNQNNKQDSFYFGFAGLATAGAESTPADNYVGFAFNYELNSARFRIKDDAVNVSTSLGSLSQFSSTRRLSARIDPSTGAVTLEVRDPADDAVLSSTTGSFSAGLSALSAGGMRAVFHLGQHATPASTRYLSNIVWNP
eukprot:jgi/Tetstr1/447372/TSEL_034809.t1